MSHNLELSVSSLFVLILDIWGTFWTKNNWWQLNRFTVRLTATGVQCVSPECVQHGHIYLLKSLMQSVNRFQKEAKNTIVSKSDTSWCSYLWWDWKPAGAAQASEAFSSAVLRGKRRTWCHGKTFYKAAGKSPGLCLQWRAHVEESFFGLDETSRKSQI